MPAFPEGWPRAPRRRRAQFDADLTIARAMSDLQRELRMIGASQLRIEHDLEVRNDGLPRSGQRQPADVGVVVYFTRGGQKIALACDQWDRVEHNLRAIAYTLEAKRAITRWGCATAEAEYRGYEALPPRGGTTGAGAAGPAPQRPRRPPHEVLHIAQGAPPSVVNAAFRTLAKNLHPDASSGDEEAFTELVNARDELLRRSTP